jgi:hypothetical protein
VRRSRFWPRFLLWCLGLAAGGFLGYSALRAVQPPPGPPPDAGPPAGDAGAALPSIVKITIQTIPPVRAEVFWGRKRLGIINPRLIGPRKPLIVERPRDSGPMDLVIRAKGYLPVNTRAYTFNDGRLNVKLTLVTEKHLLLGWKQALPDAGVDAGDGGLPPGPPLPPDPHPQPPQPLPPLPAPVPAPPPPPSPP